MGTVYERQEQLYGKQRKQNAENVKKALTKDSVLQEGEYNYENHREKEGIWKSSSARDFAGDKLGIKKPPDFSKTADYQLHTHFEMRAEGGPIPTEPYQGSTAKDDYVPLNAPKPEVVVPDNTVHWPDMAPQYSEHRDLGNTTEYNTSFPKKKTEGPAFPKINTCKVSLPEANFDRVRKKRDVSILIGADKTQYQSENRRSYSHSAPLFGSRSEPGLVDMMKEARLNTKFMRDQEWQSAVFRTGDYNNYLQGTASIHHLDYGKTSHIPYTEDDKENMSAADRGMSKIHPVMSSLIGHTLQNDVPLKFQEAAYGKNDQTSAHFFLGSEFDKPSSMYSKDYEPGTQTRREYPGLASAPAGGQVLQRDPHNEGTGPTTAGTEHGQHTNLMAQSQNSDLAAKMAKNIELHSTDHVLFSLDKGKHKGDRQKSLMHEDFLTAPGGFKAMAPRKEPRPEYNYLETEVVLPYAVPKVKPTESQYQYTGAFMEGDFSVERRRAKKFHTKTRQSDGLATHFDVGYVAPNFDSSHKLQFTGRAVNDEHIPPAGVKESAGKSAFKHYDHSDNLQDLTPDLFFMLNKTQVSKVDRQLTSSMPALPVHSASIMKNDYQPLGRRYMTKAQLNMLHQDRKISSKPVESSHLFHTDTSGRNNFESTAMSDFIQPVTMTGRKTLEAR